MLGLVPLPYKLGAIAALLVLVGLGGFWLYDRTWDKGYSQHKLEMVAASAKVLADHVLVVKKAGEDHAKNQLTINSLATQLGRMRVKVTVPSCPTSAEEGSDGRAREFSDKLNEALGRLQESDGSAAQRCDQLNIDSIESNAQ